MERAKGPGRKIMWKELGKALVISVVIPVVVQVLQQLALKMAEEHLNNNRDNLPSA